MKIDTSQFKTETTGVDEELNYTIETNAFMADILSKRIYSRHIEAVIRELSTNAWDSHCDAGHRNPFKVVLPTKNSLLFTLRDFGTGLSKKSLKELYTVFGRSNRRDSDDYTGLMGLGSKAPFAYTKSFITISYFNGEKISCTNFQDENGNFKLAFAPVEKTTEPNGLEIQIPVKMGDEDEFNSVAKNIYRWFPVFPDINLEHDYPEPSYCGPDWSMFKKKSWGNDFSAGKAIMGNICYNIDCHSLGLSRGWSATKETLCFNLLYYYDIALFFDIGELDVNAGREDLQYTENTRKKILEKCKSVLESFRNTALEKISEEKNRWEATIRYSEVVSEFSDIVSLDDLEYKEEPLKRQIKLTDCGHIECIELPCYRKNIKRTGIHQVTPRPMGFIINDLKKGIYKACKQFLQSKKEFDSLVLCEANQVKKICETLDIDENYFDYASNHYIKPQITRTKRANKVTETVFKFNSAGHNKNYSPLYYSRYWEPLECDISKGGVFTVIDRYKSVDSIEDFARYLHAIGIPTENIFGVKKSTAPKFSSHKKWINLKDHLKKKLLDLDKSLLIDCRDYEEVSELNRNYRHFLKSFDKLLSGELKTHFAKIKSKNWVEIGRKYQSLQQLKLRYGLKTKKEELEYDFKKRDKELSIKYPILNMVKDNFVAQRYESVLVKNLNVLIKLYKEDDNS